MTNRENSAEILSPTQLLNLIALDSQENYGIYIRRVYEESVLNCIKLKAPFGVGDAKYAIGSPNHIFMWTRRLTKSKVAACIHEIGHILFDVNFDRNCKEWLNESDWLAWEALVAIRLGCWRSWDLQMKSYGVSFTRFKNDWEDLDACDKHAVLTKALWNIVSNPEIARVANKDIPCAHDPFEFLLN